MKRMLIGLAMLALVSCSSVTVLRTSEMERVGKGVTNDVNAQMRQQLDSLRHDLDSLKLENAKLQKRLLAEVSLLNKRVGDGNDAVGTRLEEVLYRLDLLVDASAKPIKRIVVDKRGETSTGSPAGESAAIDSVHAAVQTEVTTDPALEKLYSDARADFHKSEYKVAYEGFKQVYEKAGKGDLAENALYWMGLCLTETAQPDKAQVVFQRLIEQFPTGKKVCVVLLKLAQMSDGKKDAEILLLQRLTSQPQCRESNEALKAIDLIDQLSPQKATP